MKLILILTIFISSLLFASEDHQGHDDHHGHGGGKAIGQGKAITEVDEHRGFSMSKEAIETIGVELQNIEGPEVRIPKEALIVSEDQKGVYLWRNNFFKMSPVKNLKEDKGAFLVTIKYFKAGDQLVIKGTGLLRVTDIYSTDKSEYGHGH